MTQAPSTGRRSWRSDPITRAVTLTPLALVAYLDLLPPVRLGTPMFTAPPAFLGLPLGVWLQTGVLGWAAAAAAIVWTTSSRAISALALVFGTFLSVLGIFFGPALILILQNLGS